MNNTTGIRRSRSLIVLLAVLGLFAAVLVGPTASAAPPPKNSEWSEHYFMSVDGITRLHADVLRPKGMSDKQKTPVILTVSPYTNHSGATTDYDPGAEGPSDRFYDFLEVSDILDRGYTYVTVDLPGFGGSGGCNDWGGPAERGAVKAAVEWAASQKWSTGKVGMMGKSYDGWTGLMGMAEKPNGLAAVVSMEPVYSGYRYLYNNGVRFVNSVLTPAGFQAYDAKPGTVNDDPMYNANGAPQAYCYGVNWGMQQQDEEDSAFWAARNLLPPTKGVKTPLFLTQGFLETNTKQDAAFDFYNGLGGRHNRAWFGQFDHYRGWEKDESGRYYMGRKTFVKEMMLFLERHLKGKKTKQMPGYRNGNVSVQDNLGRYRNEAQWPPFDSQMYWTNLRKGSYTDDGRNSGAGTGAGNGIWTFSQKVKHDVWIAGEPKVKVSLDAVPRANIAANLYDIAPNGTATLVSRGTKLLRGAIANEGIQFEMYGQDWLVKKGHRVGVILSSANSDWWLHVPTNTPVTVKDARIGIPFLRYQRNAFVDGKKTTTLEGWLASEIAKVEGSEIKQADSKFRLPGRLRNLRPPMMPHIKR